MRNVSTRTAPTNSRTSVRAQLAAVFLGAAIAAVTVSVASASPASAAPSSGAYLGWSTPAPGPCPAKNFQSMGDFSFDPAAHRQRIYAGTFKSGYFQTRKWVDNGVSRARKFDVCQDGKHVFTYNPLEYKHRHYQQEWNCANLSCRYLSDHTSSWVPGTEFPPNPCPGSHC